MRILMSCVAGSQQHLNCLLPLARAAVDAGDTVALASGPDRAGTAARHSLTFFAVGDSFAQLVTRARLELPAYRLGGDDEEVRTYTNFFARLAGPRAATDLVEVIRSFGPDLVLHETAEFGAPLAATLGGIPYATVATGPPVPARYLESAGAALAETWATFGLTPDRYGGMYQHVAVDIFPASLRGAAEFAPWGGHLELRPTAARLPDQGVLSSWVGPLEDRPTVHVSFGTAAWNRAFELMKAVIEGLQDEDVNVVVVVGPDNDPAELGSLPPNVVARSFIPHSLLMPECQAIVTHGGSGTILSALEFGVPLLVVPQGGDQFRAAEAVERSAAGLAVKGSVTAEAVRLGVQLLLSHPIFRAAASRVAGEIAGMPSPNEALANVKAALVPAEGVA
jgi:UDP:flavonoid glycosyltransferase YjiC (YdhE family)